jgi:aminopeptidase N
MASALALGALGAVAYSVGRALWLGAQVLDSGGPLRELQAAYDVRRYDLVFTIEPERRFLSGRSTATVVALAPLERFEIQLHDRLEIARVAVDGGSATFEHDDGLVSVELAPAWHASERHAVEIVYSGRPKVSVEPPWLDGFVWATTASGAPWVAVTVQGDGADDWWPAKDHPSDEPDEGVSVELSVPAGLVGLSNGRKQSERTNADGSVTSFWRSRYPINNYLVTINAAPYVEVVERYRGADGSLDVPMTFFSLPEHLQLARAMWRGAPEILAVFARRFGEFPFLDDKIAVVDAPMSGMEHQTLIAYGDDFLPDDSGIDETLVHELAHEWWGNKISVREWDDFWIQEGFATYAEALFVEAKFDAARARDYVEGLRFELENRTPLVAGRPRTAAAAYSSDVYYKGAWVLHTLRWQIGDDAFFRVLARFADDPPGACRLVDSAELARLVARESGLELDWFWQRYLRQAKPPAYSLVRRASADGGDDIALSWDDPSFELALPVEVAGELRRVEMPGGRARFQVPAGTPVEVARAGRVLAEEAGPAPR